MSMTNEEYAADKAYEEEQAYLSEHPEIGEVWEHRALSYLNVDTAIYYMAEIVADFYKLWLIADDEGSEGSISGFSKECEDMAADYVTICHKLVSLRNKLMKVREQHHITQDKVERYSPNVDRPLTQEDIKPLFDSSYNKEFFEHLFGELK